MGIVGSNLCPADVRCAQKESSEQRRCKSRLNSEAPPQGRCVSLILPAPPPTL
jgi:hypothetical protein